MMPCRLNESVFWKQNSSCNGGRGKPPRDQKGASSLCSSRRLFGLWIWFCNFFKRDSVILVTLRHGPRLNIQKGFSMIISWTDQRIKDELICISSRQLVDQEGRHHHRHSSLPFFLVVIIERMWELFSCYNFYKLIPEYSMKWGRFN